MAEDKVSVFAKFIDALGLSGVVAIIVNRYANRKKEKVDFWKSQFESAQKTVSFWEENGNKLQALVVELSSKYDRLEIKYNELEKKYQKVLSEIHLLNEENKRLKNTG
jgi:chromosome segregation ATPase